MSALYTVGLTLFALSCVLGSVYALTRERAAPPLTQGYFPHVDRLLAERRFEEALDQMHHAALIETGNVALYRRIVHLAAVLGDEALVRVGARGWAVLDASDPEPHARLCANLIDGLDVRRIDADDLALVEEAMDHGRMLIVLEPESTRGYRCLGMAFLLHGGHSGAPIDYRQAAIWLGKALALDPQLEDMRRWLRYARSKGGL